MNDIELRVHGKHIHPPTTQTAEKSLDCGGLNRNGPHTLAHLNAESSGSSTT